MIRAHQLLDFDDTAIRAQLSSWLSLWPDSGVFAILPESEKEQVAGLQQLCRELAVPLVGAVFPSLVTQKGFVNQGTWLVCLDPMPATFLLTDIAKQGGQRADTQIDLPPAGQQQFHASVLGYPLFGNVHPRNHLDPRGQLFLDGDRWRGNFPQLTINPEPNPIVVFVGFKVQVGSAHAVAVGAQ